MTGRIRRLLPLVLPVVVGILAWNQLVGPARVELDRLRAEKTTLEARVEDLARTVAAAEEGTSTPAGVVDEIAARLDALVPVTRNITDVELALPGLFEAAGATGVTITKQPEAPGPDPRLHQVTFNVAFQASPEALLDILGRLRTQTRLITVQNLNPGISGEDQWSVSMSLQVWFRPPADPAGTGGGS